MFSSITFWCEFPEKVDWKKLEIPFKNKIYLTASSRKEFEAWRKKIPKKFELGVWPILPKGEGYWFSGFCSRESIDRLKEFEGLDVKVDIEPPIPNFEFNVKKFIRYGVEVFFLKKARNNLYLKKSIENLSSDLIISGLPLPEFLLKTYGDNIEKVRGKRNFFIYKTFTKGFLADILNIYYRWFIRSRLKMYKERAMFAIGCTGPGILGNEPVYSSLRAFEKDLKWFERQGVKNLVVFNLEGILERADQKEWFEVLRKFLV